MLDRSSLLNAGKYAWALAGLIAIGIVTWIALSTLAVVTVPLILALFPAAALAPVMRWLAAHRVPNWLAAILVVLALLIVLAGLVALVVPPFVEQAPRLMNQLRQSSGQLQQFLQQLPGIGPDATLLQIVEQIGAALFGATGGGGALGTAVSIGRTVLSALGGLLLVIVILFFYFFEGRWMVRGSLMLVPRRLRDQADEMLRRMWFTLGGYFRSLFIIAVADSALIGIGLWAIGVPLVLPLAVLVFFGGFFPYLGATASGLIAVLVAFADGGLYQALAALGVVLAVQVIEGNLLQPLVAGRLTQLPAFVVIVAVAAGGALLGIFGAFIAVPATAVLARGVGYVREQQEQQADREQRQAQRAVQVGLAGADGPGTG